MRSPLTDAASVRPPGSYLKKIIEDAGTVEETGQLLRYCTWENPAFSSMALTELLWQISYSYNYELRPYLELLLQLLLVEDSWQTQRILNALKVRGGLLGRVRADGGDSPAGWIAHQLCGVRPRSVSV